MPFWLGLSFPRIPGRVRRSGGSSAAQIVTLVPLPAGAPTPTVVRMAVGRKTAVMVAAAMAAVEVVYAAWVRPRLMRWGATDEEVAGPYPGAELIPRGQRA